jgi:hypothetical protein
MPACCRITHNEGAIRESPMSTPSPGSTPKTKAARRAERLVYESPSRKALKRSHPTVPGADGKQHLYLNDKFPLNHQTGELIAPLETAVCGEAGRCGHAYAHLMVSQKKICAECAIDISEARVKWIQEQTGAELGYVPPARICDHAAAGVQVHWQHTKI